MMTGAWADIWSAARVIVHAGGSVLQLHAPKAAATNSSLTPALITAAVALAGVLITQAVAITLALDSRRSDRTDDAWKEVMRAMRAYSEAIRRYGDELRAAALKPSASSGVTLRVTPELWSKVVDADEWLRMNLVLAGNDRVAQLITAWRDLARDSAISQVEVHASRVDAAFDEVLLAIRDAMTHRRGRRRR